MNSYLLAYIIHKIDTQLNSSRKIAINKVWTTLLFQLHLSKSLLDQVKTSVGVTTFVTDVEEAAQPLCTLTKHFHP